MQHDNSRTLVITIKGNVTHEDGERMAQRVRSILELPACAVALHLVEGADRIYVGSRPDKRARLEAIQSLPESMTSVQIAATLGLSERQVQRYRSLLKALSSDADRGDTFSL